MEKYRPSWWSVVSEAAKMLWREDAEDGDEESVSASRWSVAVVDRMVDTATAAVAVAALNSDEHRAPDSGLQVTI